MSVPESVGYWQNIIDHRAQLVKTLAELNIKISDPNSMKTRELEELVGKHLTGGRKRD